MFARRLSPAALHGAARRSCVSSRRLAALLLGLAGGLLGMPAGASQPRFPAAAAEVAAEGRARVLVEVIAPAKVGRLRVEEMARGMGELEAAGDRAGARRLRRTIAQLQQPVLDAMAGSDAQLTHRYATVPWVALSIGPVALARLERDSRVGRVDLDLAVPPTLDDSVPLIQGDAAHARGFDGRGTAVAIIDSGVDAGHSFFGGRVTTEACFSAQADCPGNAARVFGPGAAEPCLLDHDGCEHGTHVAGIAVGAGGVAPRAEIVAANVFSYFTGEQCGDEGGTCVLSFTSDQIAALEWVFDERQATGVVAVNMSLGGGQFFDEGSCDAAAGAKKQMIDNLRAVGIASVIASGNDGFTDSMGSPGCISTAIAVGSTRKNDAVSSFSNSATFLELLAPGSSIESSLPGGGFGTLSGTSMATPHVAGAWALVKQAQPNAGVDRVLQAFTETGRPIFDDRNGLTFPRINVLDAIESLSSGGGDCVPSRTTMCLLDGRFRVQATWSNQFNGTSGNAGAVPSGDVAGFFWFSDPANVELLVKILDFGDVVKVFYGQLTDLRFTLTVTDTETGQVKRYGNSSGECGAIDQNGFPSAQGGVLLEKVVDEPLAGTCRPSTNELCLLGNRFRVTVDWRNQYNNQTGVGAAGTLSNLSGFFTYTDPNNVELLVKALDFGSRVLFFFGALSDLQYTIRVSDTVTGAVKSYFNPPGRFCGGSDTNAFSGGSGGGTNVGEREPNDSINAAQPLSGAVPIVVSASADTFDVGLGFTYNDGTREDIEDLYRITLRSSGLVATVSGHSADLDLFLLDSRGRTFLQVSNAGGTAVERIELPGLAPGTYYLGVSIYDPAPLVTFSTYTLFVNGGL